MSLLVEMVRRLNCWPTVHPSQCQDTCISICSGQKHTAPKPTGEKKNPPAALEPIRLSRRNSRRPLHFTIDLGTPPTRVGVRPVSYSTETWILSNSASYCQTEVCNHGIFSGEQSSTYTETAPPQANVSIPAVGIEYGGHGFQDTVKLAGVTAVNMSMKLALQSTGGLSLLGLDHRASSNKTQEGSFLGQLVSRGMISTMAYNDNCGSILFSAVDHSKYAGTLRTLRTHKVVASAWGGRYVALSGLNASSSTGTDVLIPNDTVVPVQVVFGKWTNVLPASLAVQMWRAAGAHYSAHAGAALLPCAKRASAGHFRFQLGGARGPIFRVGMRQLVVPTGVYGGGTEAGSSSSSGGVIVVDDDDDVEGLCALNLANSSDPADWRLGDGFLRAAYVLFDPHRRRVAVAPLVSSDAGPTITESVDALATPIAYHDNDVVVDGSGVPLTTLVPDQPADLDVPFLPASPEPTSLSSAEGFELSLDGDSSDAGNSGHGGGLSRAAQAAIGIGVSLGALLALAFLLWLRARRHLHKAETIIEGLRASISSAVSVPAAQRAHPSAHELPTELHGPGPTYELGEIKARERRELPS